ncbi:MAG: hypothetical protein ABW049_10725 [Spongiibacteraceae bacterium]
MLGIELASTLHQLYPERFDLQAITGMIESRAVVNAIQCGEDPRAIALSWSGALYDFVQMRQRYLLY